MIKHTRGPWTCVKWPKVFSIQASGRQIAIMTEHHGDTPLTPMSQFERSDRDAADARLIAAAPEMYDLLRACEIEVMPGEEREPADGELWRHIRAVLKKVHGEA